ncbi:MAG: hypothetical protein ABI807_14610 [Sporichthyaceae bacterium]
MSFPEPPAESRPGDEASPLFGPTEALESHPEQSSGGRRRVVVTAALAVLGLAAAGVTGAVLVRGGAEPTALAAATSTPSASPSAGTDGRVERHGFRGGPAMMGLAGALHGELVVPGGSGGYQTVVVQRGTATKVGSDSITVTSDDGFTATYDVPPDTPVGARREGLGSITTGANVVVIADKKGSTLTATHVMDLDSIRAGMGGFGRHGGPGDDGDGPGVPAPTASSEGSSYGA